MRRAAGFLFLLVFGLFQAGALECPMGSTVRASAPAHHPAHHHHPSSPGGPHHDGHGQAGCAVVMSCGAAAVPSSSVAIVGPWLQRPAAAGRLPSLYLSPVLAIDSPPPRAAAAA